MELVLGHQAVDITKEGAFGGQQTKKGRFHQFYENVRFNATRKGTSTPLNIMIVCRNDEIGVVFNSPVLMLFVSFATRIYFFCAKLSKTFMQFTSRPIESDED